MKSRARRLKLIEQAARDAGGVRSRWHRLIVDAGPIDAPIATAAEIERQERAAIESGAARQGDRFIVHVIGSPPVGSIGGEAQPQMVST